MSELVCYNYDKLGEYINNIAGKYSRNTSIPFEDFSQELWVKALQCLANNITNMAIITKSLVNEATNLSRSNWKLQNKESNIDFTDPVQSEVFVVEKSEKKSSDNYLDVEIIDTLNDLRNISEKAYKYAVAKAYLNGNLDFLEPLYFELYDNLSESNKFVIINNSSKKYTDDIILKVFCELKSGTNSGTARQIKRLVKSVFIG